MNEPWRPRPYQKRAVQLMLGLPAFGLFLHPGLGKTSIALATFEVLRRKGFVKKLLVLAPLRPLQLTWPEQIERWSDFAHLRVAMLHGPKKEKALRADADVYLLNYEGLYWLSTQPSELWPDMLVADESTKLKHPRTQRFKTLRDMLPRFKRRYILTGTPTPNGLLDLFGQIYVLDQGKALGRYVTHYRREFFFEAGFRWIPLPGSEDLIREKIAPLVMHLDAKDHVDLPPLVKTNLSVPFPGAMRDLYGRMRRELVVALKSGTVTAKNAGVLTTKLRQLTGGAVYLDEDVDPGVGLRGPKRVAVVHDAKLDALEELIEELSGQPLIVVHEYDHERVRIQERLGQRCTTFGGSKAQVREIERRWNDGEVDVLLVHPQAAAHGLNLQAGGAHLCWYSLPWNLELYDQMIDRIWRPGQERKVFVYHLVVRETVDEVVLKTLGSKARTQADLLEALKEDMR